MSCTNRRVKFLVCPTHAINVPDSWFVSVDLHGTSCDVTEHSFLFHVPHLSLASSPIRSTSRLFAPRSGGRWSVRCRPRRLSAREPSLPIRTRPARWFKQSSTPGSLSTCAASLLAHDRTQTRIHLHTLNDNLRLVMDIVSIMKGTIAYPF